MADVTQTPASVVIGVGNVTATGTAGATIVAGDVLYKDLTDSSKLKLTDADALLTAVIAGIAVGGAAANQLVSYQHSGPINPGGTVVKGTTYVASVTPGNIAPQADLVSGDFVSILGVAISTTEIQLKINNSGIAI